MAKPLYTGRIVNSKVLFNNRNAALNKLKQLEGKEVEMTIEEKRKKIEWNKYYWAHPVEVISEHTGSSPKQVHKYLKSKYLSEIIHIKDNGSVSFLDSTTKLTDNQWEKYINLIIAGEAHEGYEIKRPGEIDYE